ncbi:MAG: DUF1080 domain-containing protein, partial [Gillisia sp.]
MLFFLMYPFQKSFSQENELDPSIGDWKAEGSDYFAQVYTNDDGIYKLNVVKDLPYEGEPLAVLQGEDSSKGKKFQGSGWSGYIENNTLFLNGNGDNIVLKRYHRSSPSLNAPPPQGAIVLFDGENLDKWKKVEEKDWLKGSTPADNWKILPGGVLQVVTHPAGEYESIITKQKFGDIKLHLEFRLLGEKTNGGVYLMSRYEMNIKDAYGHFDGTPIGFGNISDPKNLYPSENVSFPPGEWQTFDIDFQAPRFDKSGTKKIKDAHMTVVHNGYKIYDDVALKEVKGSTAKLGEAAVGPIYLQEHGSPYQFRNIWVIDKTVPGTEGGHTISTKHHKSKSSKKSESSKGKGTSG